MRRGATPAALLVALLVAGCVYYPTIRDVGGIQIRPTNGRAVVQPSGLIVYMDIESTGFDGDAVIGATSDVARNAVLVVPAAQTAKTQSNAPIRLEVPGAATVRLTPDGPHIELTDLTRTVARGDTVLITLLFEKLGRIGVPARIE